MAYPSNWKEVYLCLIDPQVRPEDIVSGWKKAPSLLLRTLRGKRIQQKLAIRQEVAMMKHKAMLFHLAGTVGEILRQTISDTPVETKRRGCHEIMSQIKEILEIERRDRAEAFKLQANVAQPPSAVLPSGGTGCLQSVSLEPATESPLAGENTACEQALPPEEKGAVAAPFAATHCAPRADTPDEGSVESTLRTAGSNQTVPPGNGADLEIGDPRSTAEGDCATSESPAGSGPDAPKQGSCNQQPTIELQPNAQECASSRKDAQDAVANAVKPQAESDTTWPEETAPRPDETATNTVPRPPGAPSNPYLASILLGHGRRRHIKEFKPLRKQRSLVSGGTG